MTEPSTALTRVSPAANPLVPQAPSAGPPRFLTPREAMETGAILAQSQFFPDAKEASRAAAKILMGQELGLLPMAAMKNIYVLSSKDGRVNFQVAAATQLALVRRSGRYDYKVLERTAKRAAIKFMRIEFRPAPDGHLQRVVVDEDLMEYTDEDDAVAGGSTKQTHQAHPKNMLFWRCVTNGVASFCPDVLLGPCYTEGEFGEDVGLPTAPQAAEEILEAEAHVVESVPAPKRKPAPTGAPKTVVATVVAPTPNTGQGPVTPAASPAILTGPTTAGDRSPTPAPVAPPVKPTPEPGASPAKTEVAPAATEAPSGAAPTPAEESLDRLAAAAGITPGDGPLAPDGPATTEEKLLVDSGLLPFARARALVQRIAALSPDAVLCLSDAKDVNNYLKELLPGSGAKAAWKAVLGREPTPSDAAKITQGQVLQLCAHLSPL